MASNWNTAIGDEEFLSGVGAAHLFAEADSEVAHRDAHPFSAQHDTIHLYISSMLLGARHRSKLSSHRLMALDRTDGR